jgi:hypothetical protein
MVPEEDLNFLGDFEFHIFMFRVFLMNQFDGFLETITDHTIINFS